MRNLILAFTVALAPLTAVAHDTWVETNTALVRQGDVVFVDLKLGNHGNDHRDFKLASKITLAPCQLSVIGPDGKAVDLKPGIVDTGYAPKEGYWSGRFVAKDAGLHVVSHTLNTLHGTTRAIKSGKTYFQASRQLDAVPADQTGFDKPLGHAMELVPLANPITAMGPNEPIRVKLFYQSKPLAGARVSFIPRGATLTEGFDKDHEAMTDTEGVAAFIPKEGNVVLVVVHHPVADQKGDGFEKTHYTATLTISVPQISRISAAEVTSK
ncbi:DUF4198 domain-containing protein [Schlesneria paludicola]|uniref:DUF4198 domain-containing protein n=1 Tax=Schlesneria paludicola TaxID=360056 RepID=UPI00029A8857|nr:DUF4198 domain-containing protein [Schlesneria paludicola]